MTKAAAMTPCDRCGGDTSIVEWKRIDGTKVKVMVCKKCGLKELMDAKELRREDANNA